MKFSDNLKFNPNNKKTHFIPDINNMIGLFKTEIVSIEKIQKLKIEDDFETIEESYNYDDIKNNLKPYFINFSEEYNEKLKSQIVFNDDEIYFHSQHFYPTLNIIYLKDIQQINVHSEHYQNNIIKFSLSLKDKNNQDYIYI